jgi:hypothetical protein
VPTADGQALHRPYDGGVELIPSQSPRAQIIRQTRRYFRYQSGKGMQMSKAINFSAPWDVQTMTRMDRIVTISTRSYHRLTVGINITVLGATGDDSTDTTGWNGSFVVASIVDPRTFTFELPEDHTISSPVPGGFPRYVVDHWNGASLRVGMFDDQNGLFFEYDGDELYCVRRNSVQQLPGFMTATFYSSTVTGSGTSFTTQLQSGSRVVIKGMTYSVVSVNSDTDITIMPAYRGVTNNFIIGTLTQEVRIPRTQWSIDKCDGTGPSGYELDIHKIQMVYIDFSWYGAGKVRFGFKNTTGEVSYVHEFVHNNLMDEAYLRSGNLPARYEVENTDMPTYVPALMHWGTSVIMDGMFDTDKAYMFTAAGKQLSYANGDVAPAAGGAFTSFGRNGATNPFVVFDPNSGANVSAWRITFPANNVRNIKPGTNIKSDIDPDTILPEDTKVVIVTFSGASGFVFVDRQPLVSSVSAQTFMYGDPADNLPPLVPLVSIRLAPSVDNNRPGALGMREIVNRMQLQLNQLGVLTTHDCEIRLIINGFPSNKAWVRPDTSSLSQLILHDKGDILTGGQQIFTARAGGGSTDASGRKLSNSTLADLGEVMTLGNSILGGDDVFPNGPDIITLCAVALDTTGISTASPFTITARLSWQESQA